MSGEKTIQNRSAALDHKALQPPDLSGLSETVSHGETITGMIGAIPHLSARQILAGITRPAEHRKVLSHAVAESQANIMITAKFAEAVNRPLGITVNALTIAAALAERQKSLGRPMGFGDYFTGSMVGVSRVVVESVITESVKAVLVNGAGLHPVPAILVAAGATPMIREASLAIAEPVLKEYIKFSKQRDQADREMAEAMASAFSSTLKGLKAPSVQPSRKDQGLASPISPAHVTASVPAPTKPPVARLPDRNLGTGAHHSATELNLNPVAAAPQLTVPSRDPKPSLDAGKLLASVPKTQGQVYDRAAAGWEAARARGFSSGMQEAGAGVSVSVTITPEPSSQFGPMEGLQRDLSILRRELTSFSEVANRTEQSLKFGETPDFTALQQAKQRAVAALQMADPSLFSSGGQQAEIKKITDRSEQAARTVESLDLPPQAGTYERLVELHERGNHRDYLKEVDAVKEQVGGDVRKELELRGAFSEAALAKTPEAQREASRKIQEVRGTRYPALKDGQAAFDQTLEQASKACHTLKREHFSSLVPVFFGPSKVLVESVKDYVRTDMARLGKTAVDGVLSGSGDALSRSNLAQRVQAKSEIRDLAKAAQLDLKSSSLPAHLQKAETLHQANKASLERLETAAPELRRQLETKAVHAEAAKCIRQGDSTKAPVMTSTPFQSLLKPSINPSPSVPQQKPIFKLPMPTSSPSPRVSTPILNRIPHIPSMFRGTQPSLRTGRPFPP
jgi:hypothetical protein